MTIPTNKKINSLDDFILADEPTSYGYDINSGMALGRGFNPTNLNEIKRGGIDFIEKYLDGAKSDINAFYVSNFESFENLLKIDRSMSASYLSNSLSYSSKSQYDNSFSSNSVTVVIKAETDYGRWALDAKATLTEQAKERLSEPQVFAETYGTRYVAVEKRRNAIFIIITFYSTSITTKKAFETSLSAGGGFGAFSAKAKSTFNSEIKNSSNSQRLSLEVVAHGGTGIAGLKDIIIQMGKVEKNPIESIFQAVGNALASFTIETAKPYSYTIAKMQQFGLKEELSIPWNSEREKRLLKFKELYDRINFKLLIAKGVKNKTHPLYYLLVGNSDFSIQRIIEEIEPGEIFLDLVSNLHHKCQTELDFTTFEIPTIIPTIIDTHILNYLKSSTIEFLGLVKLVDTNNTEVIPLEKLELILNSNPSTRENVVKNFYPNLNKFGVTIYGSGFGLSAIQLHSKLKRIYENESKEYFYELFAGSSGSAFDLLEMEKQAIKYFENWAKSDGNKKATYTYQLSGTLTDKASRKFEFVLKEATFYTSNNQVFELKMNYFPMGAYDDK